MLLFDYKSTHIFINNNMATSADAGASTSAADAGGRAHDTPSGSATATSACSHGGAHHDHHHHHSHEAQQQDAGARARWRSRSLSESASTGYVAGQGDTLLERRLREPAPLILDGGLATELERAGHPLDSKLWSAALLAKNPGAITAVHAAYLEAGASIITTSSYQLSEAGCLHERQPDWTRLLRLSVQLAVDARHSFMHRAPAGTPVPLIAASCGPLGAVYGDGSEFTGGYGIEEAGGAQVVPLTPSLTPGRQSVETLADFHRARLRVLADCGGFDVVAFETIPCITEVRAICAVLGADFPELRAWISLSCKDGSSLVSGEPLAEAVRIMDEVAPQQIVAIGVNCVHPSIVADCITSILRVPDAKAGATLSKQHSGAQEHQQEGQATREPQGSPPSRRVIVYPNRGETFSAGDNAWKVTSAMPDDDAFCAAAAKWAALGAWAIGGCCRTHPALIARLAKALKPASVA